MDVSVRIDCTPGEARRLIGAPDLLPLHQLLALALEDGLVRLIGRLDPERRPAELADCERENGDV